MSFTNNCPIFVVGTPRSGTTLTAKILNRHSKLFMPGETHYIDDVYSRRELLGDLKDIKSVKLAVERLSTLYGRFNESADQKRIEYLFSLKDVRRKLEKTSCNYKILFDNFMTIQMKHENKVRWGNNTPKDIFNIKELYTFYPNAKFIVCIRDVRDFLLSYKGKWKIATDENAERLRKLYHPIVTSLLWKSSMRKVSDIGEILPDNNFYIVKYEDLVTSTEEVVKGICNCIEESYEKEMIEIEYSNSSNTETKTKGIFSSSVGKWDGLLESDEIAIAEFVVKKELVSLGYKLKQPKYNKFKYCGHFVSLPFSVWKALYANKENRGPLLPYLVKRLSVLLKKKK